MKSLKVNSIFTFVCIALFSLLFSLPADAQRKRQQQKRQRPNMVEVQPGQAFQPKPGRTDYSMPWEGVDRHFIVYLPQKYDKSRSTPVVFMFHGTTGNGDKMYRISKWKEMADREGFIAVFPSSWRYYIVEKGQQQTKWASTGVNYVVKEGTKLMDDVGFVRSIVKSLTASLNVDQKRIYASGFSNGGGFVTSRLMHEMTDIFAALSAGSGLMHEYKPPQHGPVPLYQMIGSADDSPVERLGQAIPANAEDWINDSAYGIFIENTIKTLELKDTYQHQATKAHSTLRFTESQNGGRGLYILSVIQGMEHAYPNGKNNPHNFVAARRYWQFFKANPKP